MSGVILQFREVTLTDYGREFFEYWEWYERVSARRTIKYPPIAGGSGTFSNYLETHFLDHLGKTSYTSPSTYLALTTVVPDSSKTGSTITEATYTGYARPQIATGGWNAAVSGGAGGASSKTNNGAISFAACTSGSSTIIGSAGCDALTTGNMLWWSSTTSVVISTTQTPATVADQALVINCT